MAFDAEIDTMTYRGAAIDAAIPLDGGVHEIVRWKAKVDAAKETGTLTGVSLHEHGQNGLMSCKFKFERTVAVVAKFTTCP